MLLWEWVPWHWDCIYSIGQPKVKNRRNSNFWNYITCPPSHRWKLNIKAAAVLWNLVVQQLSSWTSAPFPLEILHLTVMFNLIRNQYEQIMEKFIFTKLKLQHHIQPMLPYHHFLLVLIFPFPSQMQTTVIPGMACFQFSGLFLFQLLHSTIQQSVNMGSRGNFNLISCIVPMDPSIVAIFVWHVGLCTYICS